ncbi:hypothetical protein SAMN06272771_7710 [Streptomyces sp. Ag82_O1-12]|nr:hypothetical protein SAMN06272771_7710 [Streptomyces sp. Ag82_O1-12]SOE08252.1 hypothetical protein SAMN06272727_7745 [Streptomyces sp. Ag82_G6-1]
MSAQDAAAAARKAEQDRRKAQADLQRHGQAMSGIRGRK